MIVCLGTTPALQRTLVFERFAVDAVNRATSVRENASGKSLNVARVLHTLGEPCIATGFVGGDAGEFIREDLQQSGISHDFVTVTPNTRTCTTIIDESCGQVTELVEESRQVEESTWQQLREKVECLLARAKLLVLSGSLTPGAPQDFYGWCIDRATRSDVRVILDAAGEPLARAMSSRPLLVKPNVSELGRTLGVTIDDETSLRRAIASLIERGPRWAVVTMGAKGSIVSDGNRFFRVLTPPIRAVSPIGSGDAYAAGLAAALHRNQPLPDAATLGAACAAANAMIPIAGHLRLEHVESLLPQIQLQEM